MCFLPKEQSKRCERKPENSNPSYIDPQSRVPNCFFKNDKNNHHHEWVSVRRLSVLNSRHLVLSRIEIHKKSSKIPGNAHFDALVIFQIFAADAAIEKRSTRFFLGQDWVKKSAQLIPDSNFCKKEWCGCVPLDSLVMKLRNRNNSPASVK